MPRARKHQIDFDVTPYYHVHSRCVRRAFLCGKDPVTGKDFSYRRAWAEERLALMVRAFCIEICSFALMDNHLHLVLCADPQAAKELSPREVVDRWGLLFSVPQYVHDFLGNAINGPADPQAWIEVRRERLVDISWFMRVIKEYIARMANKEDGCSGAFWEARFKSNALTTEKAVLTAMAYVDLNPVRAGIAQTPENSDHTSVQIRCRSRRGRVPGAVPLKRFHDEAGSTDGLPMRLQDYLQLVDWTGRRVIKGKAAIPPKIAPILDRIGHDEQSWSRAIKLLGTRRYAVIGPADDLRLWAHRLGQKFLHGVVAYAGVF